MLTLDDVERYMSSLYAAISEKAVDSTVGSCPNVFNIIPVEGRSEATIAAYPAHSSPTKILENRYMEYVRMRAEATDMIW